MRRAFSLLLVLVAGCVAPGGFPDAGDFPDPPEGFGDSGEVVFEVLDARVARGRCFDGATAFGEECHHLTVRVDNSASERDRETNSLHWTAVDADGRVRDFPETDADGVAAGRTVDVTVSFTLPTGAAHLETLRYERFSARGSAPVPGY